MAEKNLTGGVNSDNFTCNDDGSACACSNGVQAGFGERPVKVTLAAESDEAAWICQCGKSKNFPYCDGSHRRVGAKVGPLRVAKPKGGERHEIAKSVCRCGHSKNRPFCDGSHRQLVKKDSHVTWPWFVAGALALYFTAARS